jgi:hypothetical protein
MFPLLGTEKRRIRVNTIKCSARRNLPACAQNTLFFREQGICRNDFDLIDKAAMKSPIMPI